MLSQRQRLEQSIGRILQLCPELKTAAQAMHEWLFLDFFLHMTWSNAENGVYCPVPCILLMTAF